MTVSKFTRRAHIIYITEENLILLHSSINKEEGLEIYGATLMTLNNIVDFKRDLMKALGKPDASEKNYDNNTHFKVHLDRSKAIGRQAKLLIWTDEIEKDI